MNLNSQIYFNRQFELLVARLIKAKRIKIPTYLSIGQEHIPAIVYRYFPDSFIFPQHRCHSWFLSYGGNANYALKQMLGIVDEESNGMEGSASLSIAGKLFGHSGLLGDQIPIAVGFADSKRKEHTICVAGDAAVEEDYALGAFGYASTNKCPILFIVEDNNLSILTEKKIRRSWNVCDVARSLGLKSYEIGDSVKELTGLLPHINLDEPTLININTVRHYWHAGAGQDFIPDNDIFDKIKIAEKEKTRIDKDIEELWQLYQIP